MCSGGGQWARLLYPMSGPSPQGELTSWRSPEDKELGVVSTAADLKGPSVLDPQQGALQPLLSPSPSVGIVEVYSTNTQIFTFLMRAQQVEKGDLR